MTEKHKIILPNPIRALLTRAAEINPRILIGKLRIVTSQAYNYVFNETNGAFARCGRRVMDDPEYSPLGPEIADIEISEVCHGPNGVPCAWCYKTNDPEGHNMSFETFKAIFDKIPSNLTQIAFGIGDIDGNPDLLKIMRYCRDNPRKLVVVPNITINGARLTDQMVHDLARVCGAIAVSRYFPKDICYDAVNRLTAEIGKPDVTLQQVNIHHLLASETYNACLETLQDMKTDPRLKCLNAVVFLALKPKGDRNTFHALDDPVKYKVLIDRALTEKLPIGFDSCSANAFLRAIHGRPDAKRLREMAEPCESLGFSIYINVYGIVYPCSFLEGETGYDGIDMLHVENFMRDVWRGEMATNFRAKLKASCRSCPHFHVLN